MKVVRIKIDPTPEASHHTPFFFDVLIDDSSTVTGKHAIFGAQGVFDRKSEHFYPCCIRSDGQLDCGTGFESNDRFGHTDLRDTKTVEGALVHFSISDEDHLSFRVHIERSLP